MAQPYCTGAIHIYCGVGADAAPLYLGTTESLPGIDTTRSWDAVMNDIGGSRDPFDYIFEGPGEALISLVLTRYNQSTLDLIDTMPAPGGGGGIGFATLNDIGSLMGQEGLSFPMWLVFNFGPAMANKAVAYPGQPSGRYYPQCILWGPERLEGGTRAKKEHRIIKAWKAFDPSTGIFTLYDTAASRFSGLPAID